MKNCFNSEKYLRLQSAKIKERIKIFDKLYLEFGGKLIDDNHAARVLPGFAPDLKIRLLQTLKDKVEVILCINANDIEKARIRSDRLLSYETEVIRLVTFLRSKQITINHVVVTLFEGQKKVKNFVNKLKDYQISTHIHTFTKGYPTDVDTIVSEQGYGANPFIKTEKPLVVVSAPGACSGKLATCLSQLYHEHQRGIKAGYAKFETFPVWNLPLKHPINLAYEAATADISDQNMIDYFHLEKYGQTTVSYNRDLEIFPVVKEILQRIMKKDIYFSPTDMGVNVIAECITHPKLAETAAKNEIIRRYLKSLVDLKKGLIPETVPERIKLLMNELNISEEDRPVIARAEAKKSRSHQPSACLEINQKFICGRKTASLTPISSTFLNALKNITKIPDAVDLISSNILSAILDIKNRSSNFQSNHLRLNEVLIALSISATTNPTAKAALENLPKLTHAQLHATYLIPDEELVALSNLGIDATCSPEPDLTSSRKDF